MRTSSAKAKGRRLQDWMRDQLITHLGLTKDSDLISTAIMGESGADVKLISSILPKFPFSIECKNQEKYKGVYDILEQASSHMKTETSGTKMEPLGVIKMNHRKPIIVVDAKVFLKVYFDRQTD